MMLLFISTLSMISIALLFIRKIQSRKTIVPPGPPGLPFIGNLHQFMIAGKTHVYLSKLSNEYGPIMHMKLGSKPLLVISSAKLAKEVLKTQDSSFCSRPELLGQQKLSYNNLDVAFAPYSDHWREVRKIMTIHLLSLKKIQSFLPVIEDEISLMIKRVSDLASSGQVANLSEMTMSLFNMLICRVAFGKRYDERGSELRRFNELLHETQAMLAAFFVSDYFPSLWWVDKLFGLTNRLETTFAKLDAFYQDLIEEHLDHKWEKNIGEEGDILDVLIQLRLHNSCSIDLSWDCIKALLMIIFVAGTDTNASTVVWTMTALMKAPRVMKKVQAEIRESVSPKAQVNEDDLQNLPYLKAVISEAFRLYTPVPLLVPRESIDKCKLDGYEVEPKTIVYINAWAIARDPEYWENPHEFMPERFLENDINVKGQDFGVIPFGSGRRICPGMAMALANVELTIANLLYSFDWGSAPGVRPQNIDEDSLPGLAVHKKNPLLLVPKKFIA